MKSDKTESRHEEYEQQCSFRDRVSPLYLQHLQHLTTASQQGHPLLPHMHGTSRPLCPEITI